MSRGGKFPLIVLFIGAVLSVGLVLANPSGATTGAVGEPIRSFADLQLTQRTNSSCGGETVTILGTEGDDVLRGTSGKDVIAALGGNDRIIAAGGNDIICAGKGADIVKSGGGRDLVFGGPGRDRLYGGGGADILRGEGGRDQLRGGPGRDVCIDGARPGSRKSCELTREQPETPSSTTTTKPAPPASSTSSTTTTTSTTSTTTTTRPRASTSTTSTTSTSTTSTTSTTTSTTSTMAPLECHPAYTGKCVPIASDVDCLGGSGDGPEYVGQVRVIDPSVDPYRLDHDNDGFGCENAPY